MAGRLVNDRLIYLFADKRFREPISRYAPALKDYHAPIARILPEDWTLQRHELWWSCTPPDDRIPAQGWKIHLSATPAHAPAILVTAARVLIEAGVGFKFVIDRSMLITINGKQWGRGAAGKFITVYPKNEQECARMLEALHRATIGYWGPYILSDRRYRDSRIVHYRYGGLLSVTRMGEDGRLAYLIRDGEGRYVDDERMPYFRLPAGIVDPFQPPDAAEDDAEPGTLRNGRYKVESTLARTNSGGVYLAFDRERGRRVVIKEARPYTNVSLTGLDAVQLLKKEHRLLMLLSGSGIAPEPVEFFIDWEHAYLAEEYLEEAVTLQQYVTRHALPLFTRPTVAQVGRQREIYRTLFGRIAEMLCALHDRDIVFSDLSFANVMLIDRGDDRFDLRFIDFEGAYEEGVDLPTHLYTPGFAAEDVIRRGWSKKTDDCYALGGLLLSGVMPINPLLGLDRNAHMRYLAAAKADYGFPDEIADLIAALLDEDPSRRPSPRHAVDVLSRRYPVSPPRVGDRELVEAELPAVIDGMLRYIERVADFSREDRLFPADHTVFETNPLSVAHGACGVASALHRIRGAVDERVLAWIEARRADREGLAPGLYGGLSGIAWSLLDMGRIGKAHDVLAAADDHPLRWASPDLFHGAAGWGMTRLHFHHVTGDAAHLERARAAGMHLLGNRERESDAPGVFWRASGEISPALAHGAAGIALFLLYLHAATGEREFLEAGVEAMDWVAAQALENPEGGMTWRPNRSQPVYTPYWRWGSSGVGRVLLRYWHATGDERYAQWIERVHIDSNHKYTIFPGYFGGIAGIAEFHLDMARFPRWEGIAVAAARKALAGALLFRIDTQDGIAFPGESLNRISCDFGTGSAGIALVMHRYLTRCGAAFMPDAMLPGWGAADRPMPAVTGVATAA